VPPGRGIGEMMDRQTMWRLENPRGSKEQVKKFLQESMQLNPLPVDGGRGGSGGKKKKKKSKKARKSEK